MPSIYTFPGKHQSWADRMRQWHELTDLMTQRCAEDEPTHSQSFPESRGTQAGQKQNAWYEAVPPYTA
jgi:hypothetical protein